MIALLESATPATDAWLAYLTWVFGLMLAAAAFCRVVEGTKR